MKKRFTKRSFRLPAAFSLLVFLILTATMAAVCLATLLFSRLGLMGSPDIDFNLFRFALASIVIGTAFSRIIGKRTISLLTKLGEATQEIARGNFDVVLDEQVRADEIRTIVRNFNLMTQELAKTEVFRNDFVSNVSHEFKTPLSAIEGYAALLQNKNLSEKRRELYTSKIIYNTRRLSGLVGDILTVSRLENQEITTEKEAFSLDEQLREVLLLYEKDWSEKNLSLEPDLDGIDYYGNRELLAQVWQNLIGNAIKFTPEGGEIRVGLQKEPGQIRVTISDSGIGMSEETIERIFEKFYQGDASHGTHGNGLGLTLAKRIVDLHGGSIHVASTPGKGSTFVVSLLCDS